MVNSKITMCTSLFWPLYASISHSGKGPDPILYASLLPMLRHKPTYSTNQLSVGYISHSNNQCIIKCKDTVTSLASKDNCATEPNSTMKSSRYYTTKLVSHFVLSISRLSSYFWYAEN
jgi:hypothetical protein